MNVRAMFRDPGNFVAGNLLKFLDLRQLPTFAGADLPAQYEKKWPCVLKADATDFVVCEPVSEYPGMPPELAAEIRAKKRFHTIGADTDMPGLRADVDIVVHLRMHLRSERIDELLREMQSVSTVAHVEQPFAESKDEDARRVVYIRTTSGECYEETCRALQSLDGVARTTEMLVRWKGKMVPAVAMTVVKTGKNTWTVCDSIAQFLSRILRRNIHHTQVLTSGLKDKRAWTVQTVVVADVSYRELQDVNWPTWEQVTASRRGYFVKDVRPTNRLISQGDHAWNGFAIRVRVAGKSQAELEQYMGLYAEALKLKGEHIPDGFHLQRLGPGQDMHLFGETLLTGNYVPQPDEECQSALVQAFQDVPNAAVVQGDFGYISGDALIAIVDSRGKIASTQVDGVISGAAGEQFHCQLASRKPAAGETLVAKAQAPHSGEFGDVVFVGDAGLTQSVYLAMEAAASAGYKTVILPAVRMKDAGCIERLAAGVRQFYASSSSQMTVKVVGFYETEPFASDVEALLHRFCTDPSSRDKAEVRQMKSQLRRKWFMYFEAAEETLRQSYTGYNMSLEYEIVRRYADYDPCKNPRCRQQMPEHARSCPVCGRQQRAMSRFRGCAEAILYDLRDRLSLGIGAIQGFFANHEIARQIELGLTQPGEDKRIALPMSCEEARQLYGESEIGRECVRMINQLEAKAAPAEPYLNEFIGAYWAEVQKKREQLEKELQQHHELYRRLHSSLSQQEAERLERMRNFGTVPKAPPGPGGRVDTVVALRLMQVNIDELVQQLDDLDVPDSDTGLSFKLVRRLFNCIGQPALQGVQLPRPQADVLSSAFVKYLYMTPRDRKTGTARTRPPRRNVFAKVQGFSYTCEDDCVTMRFALPRGSYATMFIALAFDATDSRSSLISMDSGSGDSDSES